MTVMISSTGLDNERALERDGRDAFPEFLWRAHRLSDQAYVLTAIEPRTMRAATILRDFLCLTASEAMAFIRDVAEKNATRA